MNNYFDTHPELLDGLPEHWKSFSDKPWFPYVVGALVRPDERMRKRLLTEIGQQDMPERVWQFAYPPSCSSSLIDGHLSRCLAPKMPGGYSESILWRRMRMI